MLFITASLLIVVSIVFSYSLSIYTVELIGASQFHFFMRQLAVGFLGIVLMWTIARFNPDLYFDRAGELFFWGFLFIILIMPFLPSFLVKEVYGATRWIKLPGLSLSPVEFFKIGFVYIISKSFANRLIKKPKHMPLKEESLLYLPYMIIFIVLGIFVGWLQKDFGQFVLLLLIAATLLIFANRSFKIFGILGAIMLIALGTLIAIAPHRIQRIQSWWSMVQDNFLTIMPDSMANALRVTGFDEPYQVGHSLNAINNGGFTGTGLGEGSLKMGFLSEVHTDFVLAGITEEIGFIGLFLVVSLLLIVVQRMIRVSRRVEDNIYHLFTLGIALSIVFALLINFAGITGSIPIKGMAVPLLSYGGSSMLSMCIAIGLVLSISRKVPNKKRNKS
ncbi:MAG: FtsW/RodA/SpoVE family cell cycle protein [Campylobacterales bacterium]|nr:FtsW/RodA/SpoVE family cell cycle protein [Campylobacterales bacterium]